MVRKQFHVMCSSLADTREGKVHMPKLTKGQRQLVPAVLVLPLEEVEEPLQCEA